MSTVNADIRSLAEEVATSFETQATNAAANNSKPRARARGAWAHHQNNESSPSLPSSITLYRTGRILYSCHTSSANGSNGNDDGGRRSSALIDSFDGMMLNLPVNYVQNVLLHNLHHAYASLILSFGTSISTTSSVISAITGMIGKSHNTVSHSWKDIVEGTESLCGIYLSSVNACRCVCLSLSSEEGRHELELAFVSLSWVYDYLSNSKDDDKVAENNAMQKLVLKALSKVLVNGVVLSSSKSEEDMDEQLSSIMTLIQNIQSSLGEYNCALGDMIELSEGDVGEQPFAMALRSKFEAKDASQPPQLQYLLAMLRSSPKSNSKKPPASNVITSSTLQTEVSPQSEPQQSMTDIQIDHIKSVLPSLGEGYIEEALKCYNHNVERTLEALLQVSEEEGNNNNTNNVHPRLLTIPNNLPRKLRERVDHYSANVNLHRGATEKNDGKEHAKIQKEHIKHVERQAEEEAFLIENVSRSLGGLRVSTEEGADNDQLRPTNMRDEYDDDYDDQYDGVGAGLGAMDEGLYDVDIHNVHQKYDRMGAKNEQQMWRKYNSLIKDVDAESAFWEENKNMNRASGGKLHTGNKKAKKADDEDGDGEKQDEREDDGDGKKYRGPDKGRGGRLVGPDGKYLPIKRGGKKGRGGGGGGGGGGADNAAGRGAGRGAPGRGGRGRGGDGAKGESKTNQGNKPGGGGDDDMSKIQKRRKNDNKAKIGNHHRKDRATKKAAGGMMI